jgi:hypothetical protein
MPEKAQAHYPSKVLLSAGIAMLALSIIVLALNQFGAQGLLSVPLATSFWLGGSALALIVAGFVWRSRVRS